MSNCLTVGRYRRFLQTCTPSKSTSANRLMTSLRINRKSLLISQCLEIHTNDVRVTTESCSQSIDWWDQIPCSKASPSGNHLQLFPVRLFNYIKFVKIHELFELDEKCWRETIVSILLDPVSWNKVLNLNQWIMSDGGSNKWFCCKALHQRKLGP